MTMTTTKTNPTPATSSQLILELAIDAAGTVTRTVKDKKDKSTLKGTLLGSIYPNIRVARVSVPETLDAYEQALVEHAMATIDFEGVRYELIGASSSAKSGRFYAVDTAHSQLIAKRYQHWPQAAIVYFSILMTDCKLVIEEPHARVLVVEDHILGTNDCRGWIRERLYKKLNIEPNRFVQFRLAFDAQEPKQGKGAFKTMSDAIADKLGVDIVIPKSSIKPGLKDAPRRIPSIGVSGNLYNGPITLGIKSVSKVNEMDSSYQLLEHASEEALASEIIPPAMEMVRSLSSAWTEGDYKGLFQFMGKFSGAWPADSDLDEDSSEEDDPAEPALITDTTQNVEWEPVEAALLSDGSGMVVHIQYVANHINRNIARRAYRILTGGGFTLPSFALTDDGILLEHEGKILAASDWIPQNAAITSLTSEKSLTIRYPIRMKEDLLPARHLSDEELTARLSAALGISSLSKTLAADIIANQLRLEGTYSLHSKTAAEFGGDFDFDNICAMPSDRFPKFVEDRFNYKSQHAPVTKTKKRLKSPWWNLQLVAMNARGNKVGIITDLITSCLASGRSDLAYQLVEQLQNSLDSLKFDVKVDDKAVSAIRDQVEKAPWLNYKKPKALSDLPMELSIAPEDIVGRFYNTIRPVFGSLISEQRPISDVRGLFRGETVTKEMFDQCTNMNRLCGSLMHTVLQRGEAIKEDLRLAKEAYAEARKTGTRETKSQAFLARSRANDAHEEYVKTSRQELSGLNKLLQAWADGKRDNRKAWAQGMALVVTKGTGTGGVLFNTFPQELCDLIAQNTGGKQVRVRMPETPDMIIDWDGRTLVSKSLYTNPDGTEGVHSSFICEVHEDGTRTFDDTAYQLFLAKKAARAKSGSF